MTSTYGDVPFIDPDTGRLPDEFAPQAAIDAATTAQTAATTAAGSSASAQSAASAAAASAAQAASTLAGTVTLQAAAKNPDLLIVGSITRDANGVIQTADVVWPDGTAGTFTTDAVDASGAINGYHITYGSPATKTYTQPTITRDSSGAAITVPQIVVS